ncbi:MAG: hypothetical protein R6V04_12190 [bacterium]
MENGRTWSCPEIGLQRKQHFLLLFTIFKKFLKPPLTHLFINIIIDNPVILRNEVTKKLSCATAGSKESYVTEGVVKYQVLLEMNVISLKNRTL